jgi:hypothetical protein
VVVAEAVALGDDEADGAVDAAALAAADLQQQRDGSRRSELEERRRKRTALLVVYRLVRLVPVVLLALFTLALALFVPLSPHQKAPQLDPPRGASHCSPHRTAPQTLEVDDLKYSAKL